MILLQHSDFAVVASGFHGVIEVPGTLHGADEERLYHSAKGFDRGAQILMTQSGILRRGEMCIRDRHLQDLSKPMRIFAVTGLLVLLTMAEIKS